MPAMAIGMAGLTPDVWAAAIFLVGCILFSADGILYAVECRSLDDSAKGSCAAHCSMYTGGSLLFTAGSAVWLVGALRAGT